MLLQGCKRHLGQLRAVASAPMSLAERARTLVFLARVLNWDRGMLADDLRGVWYYLSRRTCRVEPASTGVLSCRP